MILTKDDEQNFKNAINVIFVIKNTLKRHSCKRSCHLTGKYREKNKKNQLENQLIKAVILIIS